MQPFYSGTLEGMLRTIAEELDRLHGPVHLQHLVEELIPELIKAEPETKEALEAPVSVQSINGYLVISTVTSDGHPQVIWADRHNRSIHWTEQVYYAGAMLGDLQDKLELLHRQERGA